MGGSTVLKLAEVTTVVPVSKQMTTSDPLVWIDCEMTGLDQSADALIEVAVVVTDYIGLGTPGRPHTYMNRDDQAHAMLDAARVAASATDTPWEPLMLAVDVRGGTVRDYTEGATA